MLNMAVLCHPGIYDMFLEEPRSTLHIVKERDHHSEVINTFHLKDLELLELHQENTLVTLKLYTTAQTVVYIS